MSSPGPAGRAGRRRVAIPLAVAVIGMGLALGGLLPIWLTQTYGTDRSGRLAQTGLAALPIFVPLVLAAGAGVIAAVITRGWAGRLIAAAAAAAGIGVVVAAIDFLVSPPANAAPEGRLPAPPDLMQPVQVHPIGAVITGVGGLVLAGAGVAAILLAPRSRWSHRFDPPVAAATTVAADVSTPAPDDDGDATDWWKSLDAGRDPTQDVPKRR